MRVYFDNNIIVDIESGKKMIPLVPGAQYFYSDVHLEELKEAGKTLETIKDKRLKLLRTLTNGKFLTNDGYPGLHSARVVRALSDPFDRFDIIIKENLFLKIIKELCDSDKYVVARKKLIENFGIDIKVQNNYTPEKLLNKYGDFFHEYIDVTAGGNLLAGFNSIFTALEMIGYWKDKGKSNLHANLSRIYDSQHAYFASACDYFVTDDQPCLMKTKVAYKFFNINTKCLSFKDYCKLT